MFFFYGWCWCCESAQNKNDTTLVTSSNLTFYVFSTNKPRTRFTSAASTGTHDSRQLKHFQERKLQRRCFCSFQNLFTGSELSCLVGLHSHCFHLGFLLKFSLSGEWGGGGNINHARAVKSETGGKRKTKWACLCVCEWAFVRKRERESVLRDSMFLCAWMKGKMCSCELERKGVRVCVCIFAQIEPCLSSSVRVCVCVREWERAVGWTRVRERERKDHGWHRGWDQTMKEAHRATELKLNWIFFFSFFPIHLFPMFFEMKQQQTTGFKSLSKE